MRLRDVEILVREAILKTTAQLRTRVGLAALASGHPGIVGEDATVPRPNPVELSGLELCSADSTPPLGDAALWAEAL